jgi:hypothetical protein
MGKPITYSSLHLAQGSQVKVESRVYQVMRYRDDMLVRLKWYSTRGEALEAAGLSQQDAHA